MSNRHKYAFNGVRFFENAREHMERNDFPRIPIGTIGGVDGWYLTIRQTVQNNVTYYCPYIAKPGPNPKIKIRYRFVFLREDGSWFSAWEGYEYLIPGFDYRGAGKRVESLLNEENGYLTNGGITIEYGFQFEGILSWNDIWTFNFHDRLFDCEKEKNMITFYKDTEENGMRFFHCHKQLLAHHSSYFDLDPDENDMIEINDEYIDWFDDFLQIAHGVRGITELDFIETLDYALDYKLSNVIQILDQTIKYNMWSSKFLLADAIYFGLEHWMADFLREQETSKELARRLGKKESQENVRRNDEEMCQAVF
uniref:BTB domain-containing protein n=1 Tax=Caenorhabditis tropicalis TaxID=1561998 RepID=A0A1I7UKS9_9PELO